MTRARGLMPLRMRLADWRGRGVYAGWPNEQQSIFIHIPKTGGTSVASALGMGPSRHTAAVNYREANPEKFVRFFKFTIVRNPWDRLVSTFAFLKAGGIDTQDARFADAHLADCTTFREFVCERLQTDAVAQWVHIRPQYMFICDGEGPVLMDFVGRFESLDRDYARIASRLGRTEPLPHLNVSQRLPYASAYDAETQQIAARFYSRDIELFGYSFNA